MLITNILFINKSFNNLFPPIFKNWFIFCSDIHYYQTVSSTAKKSKSLLLMNHHGNKAYSLLFLCNSYHQLSAIKDTVSYSLVLYCWVYIFEKVCKIIDGKIYFLTYLITYLLTYLLTYLFTYLFTYLQNWLIQSL